MTQYVATINVPGYLPTDDEPPTFDTAREAWTYLLDERKLAEDESNTFSHPSLVKSTYTPVVGILEAWVIAPQQGFPFADWTGCVVGPTPGYDGDHDLGLAYSVELTSEEG